ncbi:glycosyltransferase family 4 protein [Hephaestia mangrovi]|uniref:glycosyltransferase family 4 protein n=1 Tax=Hephaestia mangrovi TaxID=2873268 RepID=UPI001CA67477|nr:glycosyltransferase family 4 protein [Hephaestia mangrovi]MBY8828374.1 glycosyltransferase family 4 protein [Hephaestia mangrovi]
MKVLVLSSLAWSLVNFRGRLLTDLRDAGHDVIACAPDDDPAVRARLAQMGVGFALTPMDRAGTNPLADLMTLARYVALMLRERPDVVIAYTQKPIVLGGIAARIARISRFHVLMSGLGYVFSDAAAGRRLLRWATCRAYRIAVARAATIFVFNGDDRREMIAHGIIGTSHYVVQVPGSGVDIEHFAARPLPEGRPTFLMIARLMRDKGIGEFVEAARLVRDHRTDARFQLVGRPEPANPTGIGDAEIARWVDAGLIEHIPETRDVRPYLAAAHVFVLPSYYREGLPRTLLEALASGRPVITTDLPGCREPVIPGVNGWLVPPRDAPALAATMLRTIADRGVLAAMARAARERAVTHYDVAKVNAQLLAIMHLDRPSPRPGAEIPVAAPALAAEG